ncbi:YbaB/EbfC family nucleoid-associated protein [Longispora albida]|uniref:YbaB/EbfC family nucleoid-associated protein n=1 Tax=Longispora albida TaxID=203523 RepID=UPI0003648F51|nr:YbaB/EbfC family nucleoid-associated protein [Longispora albida]
MPDLPDDLLRRLQEDSEEQLRRYADVRERLANLTVTVSSPDGGVEVTAASGGAIRGVRISESVMRHGPGVLSHVILSTIQAAGAKVALETATVVQSLTGERMDIVGLVRSSIPEEALPPEDDR